MPPVSGLQAFSTNSEAKIIMFVAWSFDFKTAHCAGKIRIDSVFHILMLNKNYGVSPSPEPTSCPLSKYIVQQHKDSKCKSAKSSSGLYEKGFVFRGRI